MHFLNTELEEYREELSSLRVQLSSKASQLEDVTGERDRCRKALEEAHACVSDYHKKLSTMERTVGHALVSRGELKEANCKLEEAKELNIQYKETLAAADLRVESMTDAISEQKERIQDLESQVEHEKEQASSANLVRRQLTQRSEELEAELDEVRLGRTQTHATRATHWQYNHPLGVARPVSICSHHQAADICTLAARCRSERSWQT